MQTYRSKNYNRQTLVAALIELMVFTSMPSWSLSGRAKAFSSTENEIAKSLDDDVSLKLTRQDLKNCSLSQRVCRTSLSHHLSFFERSCPGRKPGQVYFYRHSPCSVNPAQK
jgi:hypothetical protein